MEVAGDAGMDGVSDDEALSFVEWLQGGFCKMICMLDPFQQTDPLSLFSRGDGF